MSNSRRTVPSIVKLKGERPIVCLTCYTMPMAKLLDPHVDLLLVGDTVGMIVYGMDSTLAVTCDMLIQHTKAVVKGSNEALIVTDMPFGSYQACKELAFDNAARIMAESGCNAVKLEGGTEMAETIEFLTKRGIPVVGHIGVMPQHVHQRGGYHYAGKESAEAKHLQEQAKLIESAGAFALVLECVEASIAKKITDNISIPTIGIGSSNNCDGQVLVIDDMLGVETSDLKPRFIKKYTDLSKVISDAAANFSYEVKEKKFPAQEHSFYSNKLK